MEQFCVILITVLKSDRESTGNQAIQIVLYWALLIKHPKRFTIDIVQMLQHFITFVNQVLLYIFPLGSEIWRPDRYFSYLL